MALVARRCKAGPTGLDMRTGARRQLAAGGLAAVERARYRGEFEPEHIVQQKGGALERRQPFEHQHQGDGEIMGEIAGGAGVKRFVDHRLGQPLSDIKLAPCFGRLHAVEAQARDHRAEIASRLGDGGTIRRMPAQIGILHHILGFGARSEHAVGETRQRRPMGLE